MAKKIKTGFEYIENMAYERTHKHYEYREGNGMEFGALYAVGKDVAEIVFRGSKKDAETFLFGLMAGYEMAYKETAKAAVCRWPWTAA